MKFYVFLFLSFLNLFVVFLKIKEKRNIVPKKEVIAVPQDEESISFEEIPISEISEEDQVEEQPVKEKKLPQKVSTYEEAISNAKESNSKIFIYFRSNNCHWCDQMKTTLEEDKVSEALSVYTQLEVNTSVSKEMATKFSIYGVPTYIILDSDESIIKKTSGYKDVYNFLNWLGE